MYNKYVFIEIDSKYAFIEKIVWEHPEKYLLNKFSGGQKLSNNHLFQGQKLIMNAQMKMK